MSAVPLVPDQICTLLQTVTIKMLGLPDPQIVEPPASDPSLFAVRVGWEEEGQPSQKITDDVTYIRAMEIDDQYDRQKDVSYTQSTDVDGSTILTEVKNYTRVWNVMWTVYGPNSFDNARLLRSRLFDQDIRNIFANSQLYFVPDPPAPVYAPEYLNGQWWKRVDFHARFNEFVTETRGEGYVNSVEVVIYDEFGNKITDNTVSEGGYGVNPYGDSYGT